MQFISNEIYNLEVILHITYYVIKLESGMARSGILYSDVCRAAEKIRQSGNMPTVDNVRQEMGDTGSKSTIAPMLKRWKEENYEQQKVLNSGLPESILNAVRGAYELIKAEAALDINDLKSRHQEELDKVKEDLVKMKEAAELLAKQKEELTKQLTSESTEKNCLLQERQSSKLQLASLESENAGMQNRISDSEIQLKALHQQLNSSSAQFEHYQQQSAIQRTEERHAFESRINRLEQDLKLVKLSNTELQNTSTKQLAEIQQLMSSQSRMKEIAQVQLEELSILENLQQKTQFELDETKAINNRLTQTLETNQEKLKETLIALAIAGEKQEQFKQQLKQYERIKSQSEQEQLELIKTILLQQQLSISNSKTPKNE
ncbi:DNA-binding protein [Undibacterium sp. Ji67W]|uniref:DNA-binding protein n=1 Tax=Undibacterium sp. Ji67W TaxID=3413042 RepID=UPI003BF3ECAD